MNPNVTTETRSDFYLLFTSNYSSLIALEVTCFLLGLIAIPANMIVAAFYLPNTSKLYPMMYSFNSISDSILGVASFLVGGLVVYAVDGTMKDDPLDPINIHLTDTVFCLVGVASRTSAVYSVTISVVRVINIIYPHYNVSIRGVILAMASMAVFWVSFLAVDLHLTITTDHCMSLNLTGSGSLGTTGSRALFEELFLQPLVGKEVLCNIVLTINPDFSPANNWYRTVQTVVLTGIPFFLPAGIAVACLCITAYKLLRTSIGRKSQVSRDITITVLYLTSAFVSCNAPYFVVLLVQGHPSLETSTHETVFVRLFTSTIFHFINAALTPVILIVRGTKLRSWILEKIALFGSSCKASENVNNKTKEGDV